jgi:competence protein ComEA
MLKQIIAALVAVAATISVAFAAVDINKATQAELDSVKGIGPAISKAIIDERAKGQFKDWDDMVTRVKGIGDGNAAKMSEAGLTVGGKSYAGAPAKPEAARKEEKKPMAQTGSKEEAKSAAPASAAKSDAKPAAAAATAGTAATAAAPKAAEAKKEEPKKEMSQADQAKADKQAKAKEEKEAKAKAKEEKAAKAKEEKEAKAKAKEEKAAKDKEAKKDSKKEEKKS